MRRNILAFIVFIFVTSVFSADIDNVVNAVQEIAYLKDSLWIEMIQDSTAWEENKPEPIEEGFIQVFSKDEYLMKIRNKSSELNCLNDWYTIDMAFAVYNRLQSQKEKEAFFFLIDVESGGLADFVKFLEDIESFERYLRLNSYSADISVWRVIQTKWPESNLAKRATNNIKFCESLESGRPNRPEDNIETTDIARR